jgi:DnaA family protein
MTAPRQLTLDLIRPLTPSFDNFVAGRNAETVAALRAVAAGRGDAFVYLFGAPGSGRSHLLTALAAARPAVLAGGDAVPAFDAGATLYLVDDVDRCDDAGQQRLFVLMNEVRARPGSALVTTGAAPPAQLALREDLRSRLGWGLVYEVKPLTDAERALYLRAEAERRGLRLADEVVWYLLSHVRRDMPSLRALLEQLDRASLEQHRPVTLPLVREALKAFER